MAIEFYCSQCRNRLRVDDSAAGQQAQCPVCKAITTVPAVRVTGQAAEGHIPGIGPTAVPPMPTGMTGGHTPGPREPGPQAAGYHPYATPQYYGEPVARSTEKSAEGWGVTALILGLFGLIAWCCPIIGIIIGILAVIFGILSLGKGGGTQAIIGLILGIICLALSILNALLGMAMMMADASADFAHYSATAIQMAWCLVSP